MLLFFSHFVLIMFLTSVSSSSTIIVSRLLHIKMYASAHCERVHSTGLENERSLQMSRVIFGALNPTNKRRKVYTNQAINLTDFS